MFSWPDFCASYGISFVEKGKSVAKGNVYIECPWCADGKKYMGLSVDDTKWGCWKSEEHRGVRPHRLVQALLGISYSDACGIVEDAPVSGELSDVRDRLEPKPKRERRQPVVVPDEFFRLGGTVRWPREHRFLWYLEKRGFENPARVASHYGLLGCLSGRFNNRLILPIRDVRGVLRGWTARALSRRESVRYLDYPDGSIKGYGYHAPDIASDGSDVLALVEGPFDALTLDYYGRPLGLRAAALLGLVGRAVPYLRRSVVPQFRRIVICLDPGADVQAMRLRDRFPKSSVSVVPSDACDPGDLSSDAARSFVKSMM